MELLLRHLTNPNTDNQSLAVVMKPDTALFERRDYCRANHRETCSVARCEHLGTIPGPQTCHGPMTENHNPFAKFDLERAIALRWTLRDINGKRLKLSPVSEDDLRTLLELGLVEMRDDALMLINAGHAVLD